MCTIRNTLRPVCDSQLYVFRLCFASPRPARTSAFSTAPTPPKSPKSASRRHSPLMRDIKRLRTHSQDSTPYHASSSKSPSHNSSEDVQQSDLPSSHPSNLPLVPPGIFNRRSLVIPAHPYIRSRNNPVRFYIFKNTPSRPRAVSPPSTSFFNSFRDTRRPPPRPVPPMLNYVQILSTPTADTPGTCLMVHHDNRRYLFGNISEGTQRMFVQQKVSLARTEEIFMTGPINWHTTGGLLGMILTVAEVVQSARTASIEDAKSKAAKLRKVKHKNSEAALERAEESIAAAIAAGPKSFNIHGGKNLAHLLATARRFVFRKGLPIRPHEIREDTSREDEGNDLESLREADWADENMMVWYVPVFADGSGRKTAPTTETSSRKRSFEDLEDDKVGKATSPEEQEKFDRQLVDSVVNHMFDSDWKFDALTETTLHTAKLPAKLFVKDENGHLKAYDGPMPGDKPDVPDVPVFVRQPWPAALIQALPKTDEFQQSMCYIVRNHPRRGKVNAAEITRLGVKKPDIRYLVEGRSVIAADGTTVTPEMVVGATIEGAVFSVVDLPDASYIDAFLAKPEWANAGLMGAINTIFWILGPGIATDERLQAFMSKHSAIRHTISSKDTCANNLALASAAAVQMKHNRVDPDRFPIQNFNNTPSHILPTPEATTKKDVESKPGLEAAKAGWSIRLAPQVIVEEQKVFPQLNVTNSCHLDKQVIELATHAREQVARPTFQQAVVAGNRGLPRPDVEVIPLGTGSAMPSKYRNVSATLVRVPGVGSYLFDAGENTLGSMRRLFGEAKLNEVLKEMRAIWISHLHADHHLGTVSVIRAWRDATANMTTATGTKPRLLLASHVNMLHWLREYSDIENFGIERLHMVDVECHDFPRTRKCTPVIFEGDDAAEFGLDRIDACRVEHCHGALAVVFTWAPETPGAAPFKVAYSGDCRPSSDFASIGHNATLLIHESTFDDELAGEALAKKHSTMGEAIEVGRRMSARRLLLTHFSQRYPKIPVFNTEEPGSEEGAMQILIAFDQMCVKLCDFKTAAAFLPAFQKLYEAEDKLAQV
ncbi:trna processing endoribonuclease [Ophiostoma piceae UAMH 11346]|uniref:ribonuclease Z n=1 Tax=Ophiostoma piceae (strain UAMH 11346) TaxID=1262450 RepID=S3CUT0_OPHP1|nr:trna processing endoribonuclease [Ophiostoma piceae UAMH 11346]